MNRTIYLVIAALLFLGVLALSACGLLGGPAETAAPTTAAPPAASPTTTIQETPTELPISFLDAAGAREAAIAYLRARYLEQAPPVGLTWMEENTTPQNLVGTSSLRYTSGDWVIDVQYPVVAPENLVYNLEARNQAAGFAWTFTGPSSRCVPAGPRPTICSMTGPTTDFI